MGIVDLDSIVTEQQTHHLREDIMWTVIRTFAVCAFISSVTFADNTTAVKALIITGDHEHDWRDTASDLSGILTAVGHQVDVSENPREDLTAGQNR